MFLAMSLLLFALAQQAPGEPQDKTPDQTTDAASEQKPPTPPHTGVRALFGGLKEDIKHLPSVENLYIAGVGGGLAAAVHPLDQSVNAHLISHYDGVNDIFAPAKYYGGTPI